MLKSYNMRKHFRNLVFFLKNRKAIEREIDDIILSLFRNGKIASKTEYLAMVTKHSDGDKLENMRSLSTSPLLNKLCVLRSSIPGLICHECYSVTYNNLRKQLRDKLARNTAILTSEIIPVEVIPFLNDRYFRIESFGDLQNEIQAINYLNLIIKNQETNFAWWTKNPQHIKKALEFLGIEKPANVQIVFSSPCVNTSVNIEILKKVFPFIDKVFTVYSKDGVTEKNISVNCGNRHCINCLNCYKPGGNEYINELVK